MGEQLRDVVALITGAGSGLGRGLIERFVDEGAKVCALDWDADKVDKLGADFEGAPVFALEGDVRSAEDNDRAVTAATEQFGHLDALVCCTAITDWTPSFTDIPRDKVSDVFDEVMEVNVKGYLQTALAARPALHATRGSMTFTLSTSGFLPGGQGAIYSLSKHACVGLVKQLAFELAPEIRVNAVVPGAIKDSEIRGPQAAGQEGLTLASMLPDDADERIRARNPLRRYPTPADYGGIYVLLASRNDAQVATGSLVFWDAGFSLYGPGGPRGDA